MKKRKKHVVLILLALVLLGSIYSYDEIKMNFLLHKAFALQENNELIESIEVYDEMIELNNEIADLYINKGILLYKLENNEGAIAMFKKALEIEPNAPDILYNLSIALETVDIQESERYYQLAIDNGLEIVEEEK